MNLPFDVGDKSYVPKTLNNPLVRRPGKLHSLAKYSVRKGGGQKAHVGAQADLPGL